MRRDLWHWMGGQLARPEGLAGRALGRAMAVVNRAPYHLALAALEAEAHHRVLEIGFGPGAGLVALEKAARIHPICGLDLSPDMLQLARRRNAEAFRRGRLDLRIGDMAHLPWPPASFDRLIGVNIAYFFDREGRAVSEIRRGLAPGGRAVLYATDRATMQTWRFADARTHMHHTAASLSAHLIDGGFQEDEISIRQHRLAFGISGLIAVLTPNGAPLSRQIPQPMDETRAREMP